MTNPDIESVDEWKLVPVEPTSDMQMQGLIGLVTEIIRLNGPRPELTKAQIKGTEAVDERTNARRHMDIGATMRCGLEVNECYRAMLAASPPSESATNYLAWLNARNKGIAEHLTAEMVTRGYERLIARMNADSVPTMAVFREAMLVALGSDANPS